jgi:hypothetical protein
MQYKDLILCLFENFRNFKRIASNNERCICKYVYKNFVVSVTHECNLIFSEVGGSINIYLHPMTNIICDSEVADIHVSYIKKFINEFSEPYLCDEYGIEVESTGLPNIDDDDEDDE